MTIGLFRNINFYWEKLTQNSIFFSNIFTTLFFLIGLPAILNHAMWRDELNVWLIVRDSQSLSELFHNIHYEGHPFVWYICLLYSLLVEVLQRLL